MVCRNPLLAAERARKREELLAATAAELNAIGQATARKRAPLKGAQQIALRVGRVIERYRMAKHFELTITETSFTFAPQREQIAAEAALDGLYVIRTSLPAQGASALGAAGGGQLQGSIRGGACLSQPEDRRSARAPRVPLECAAGAGARVLVHARLLRRVAHAGEIEVGALR